MERAKDWTQEKASRAKEWATEKAEKAKEWAKEKSEKAKEWAQNKTDQAKEKLEQAARAAKEAAENAKEKVWDWWNSLHAMPMKEVELIDEASLELSQSLMLLNTEVLEAAMIEETEGRSWFSVLGISAAMIVGFGILYISALRYLQEQDIKKHRRLTRLINSESYYKTL